jgi:hypothetical protein
MDAVWTRFECFVDVQSSGPGHGKQHLTLHFSIEGRVAKHCSNHCDRDSINAIEQIC